MSIGENIKLLREKRGITQQELAEAACVSGPMISQIEGNIKAPSLPVAFRIADKLNCRVEDFKDSN